MSGGGSKNSIESPRIANLQVQTSALGLVVPCLWGTGRVKVNLLWYSGFKAQAHTKDVGGKGGGGGVKQTTYTYAADVMMALSWGPIAGVTQLYKDKSTFASVGAAGLSLATGALGQATWGYLATKYPAQALGYSGLAYLYASNYALSDSATLANHSAEVQSTFRAGGLPDANPKDILSDFLTNTLYGVPGWAAGLIDDLTDYGNYCLAANLLVSPVLDSQVQASACITELMRASNSNCYWSEGLLKVRPYGDSSVTGNATTWTPNLTPAYALTDADFLIEGDDEQDAEPPLLIDKSQQDDAYNIVQVEWLDRTNQYNVAIATAQDLANITSLGRRKQDVTPLHMICDKAVAQNVVQLLLQRTLYVRDKYHFELPWDFALLEQMDLLSITDPGMSIANVLVRIVEIEDDENACRKIIAEPVPVGAASAPLYNQQTSGGTVFNQAADPGSVEANLIVWSNDATKTDWTKSGVGDTSTSTFDPFGGTAAQTMTASAGNTEHFDRCPVAAVLAAEVYTFSRYLKAGTQNIANVALSNSGRTVYAQGQINLTTGAVSALTTGGAATDAAIRSTDLGSGWWRVEIVAALPGVTSAYGFTFMCSNAGAQTWNAAGTETLRIYGGQTEPGAAAGTYVQTWAVAAIPLLFNPPSALTPGGVEVWGAAAGKNAEWGGAQVWASVNGTDYTLVGTLFGPTRMGLLSAALASNTDPDSTNTLSVDLTMSQGTLGSPSHADADAGNTISLIDTEVIAYGTSSLTAASKYDLTYLRRGSVNSPIAAHSQGAVFVRLDETIFRFPYIAPQGGTQMFVKFQSFNRTGGGLQDLATCAPYSIVPLPVGAGPPLSTAWSAVGTSLAQGGNQVPAIVITGASDNESANQVEFFYRPTGSTAWVGTGATGISTNRVEITSVTQNTSYDVSVVYYVNGVASQRQTLATSPVTTGAFGGFGSNITAGTVLLSDSVTGAGKTFTIPAGSTGHIDVEIWARGGDGNWQVTSSGKSPPSIIDYGGGGAGYSKQTFQAVTAGTTVITYTLGPKGSNSTATQTGTPYTLTVSCGADASTSAGGAGGTASGGTTNTTGHAGALTHTYDGGGVGPTLTDNTTQGTDGPSAGVGGAGAKLVAGSYTAALGAGAMILITAR